MNRSVVDYKVMYVIPNDGVGGVEVAARTVRDGYYHNLNLKKLFITDTLKNKNDIRKYVDAFKEIMNFGPDLVISSLWRSQLVTVLYKIYRPKTRHVIFFHLPSNSSFVEKIVSSISMRFSDFIWVDSAATREGRVPIKYLNKTAVISYLVEYQRPIVGHSSNADFVFWGRLHKQKNIIRALIIFSQILVVSPKSKFHIIGPDDGEYDSLVNKVGELSISESVIFYGRMDHDSIREVVKSCAFYLQTSNDEGMAMSVVEAMQYGLLPVVTPVGEIASYCKDMRNSLLIRSDEDIIKKLSDVIIDHERYSEMASRSMEYWCGAKLFKDDFIENCNSIKNTSK